jgi:LytS/YehU family sensor histidine kinase
MTWAWALATLFSGWALGFLWGRLRSNGTRPRTNPASKATTDPRTGQGATHWLERHQRLRDDAGIRGRQNDLTSRRKRLEQQTLQLQLSPHFMFNALSSVQWLWADGHFGQARETYACFLRLWQKHWTDTAEGSHSLRDELTSLEEYVRLESSRRGLDVAWEVLASDNVPWDAHVPALLFQPALENAMWHGFSTPPDTPSLGLHVHATSGEGGEPWVTVNILDNGVGWTPADPTHPPARASFGNDITLNRLQHLHPKATMTLTTASAPWSTNVQFCLPLTPPTT